MIFRSLALSLLALAFGLAAFAQTEAIAPEQFVAQAASSNMFEIESSQLALDRAPDGHIAAFAQQMIEDHSMAADRLATAAEADGITAPAEMTEAHQAKLDALAASEGAAFEAAYITAQAAAHQEAIALFTAFAATDQDSALHTFATETLPVLQQHERGVSELAAH